MQLGCVTVRVNSIGRSGQRPAAPMCVRVISSRYGAMVELRCHGFCHAYLKPLETAQTPCFHSIGAPIRSATHPPKQSLPWPVGVADERF